jgi:hypothetical protein
MELTLSNLNVNIVVQLLNGSAGETLTFVSRVIKDNVLGIMCQNIQKISCRLVQAQALVLPGVIMVETVNKKCWDVRFVETTRKIIRVFDCSI